MSTPIFDDLKVELDFEYPTPVPLTYEECVEHAKPQPAPTTDEVHESGCTGRHMVDGTNDCIREVSDEFEIKSDQD